VETTPGASGAILADWEGEAVEQFCRYDDFELKIIGAHKGIILNLIKDLHRSIAAGDPQEVLFTTESLHVVIGPVGQDYSLVMTLDRDAIVGRALCRFKETVQSLYKEIY
jgi:predicted regulator of Ras-like GTPase activity (Roadblock/LC7/MglB family)